MRTTTLGPGDVGYAGRTFDASDRIEPAPPSPEQITARVSTLVKAMSHADASMHAYGDNVTAVLADEMVHAAMHGDRLAVLCAAVLIRNRTTSIRSLRELATEAIVSDANLGDDYVDRD